MKLYHASNCVIEFPDIHHSRKNLDFGVGFYLTCLYEQALFYTERFLLRGQRAYVNMYELDEQSLHRFKSKVFQHYDKEWLEYVAQCRRGIVSAFDLVEGGVANDKVFNTIDLYFAGIINEKEALGRLSFEHPNHQLCILNQEILQSHLRFVGFKEITRGTKDVSE